MYRFELEKLTYHYSESETPALCEVSAGIGAGEFIAVIGANNSGKSTLCYALCGVVPHIYHGRMEGRVLIDGADSRDNTVDEIARQVGLVLQVPASQLSGVRYTVFEEVAFGLENRGVPVVEIRKRAGAVLVLIGLEKYAEQSPFQLSTGQQQRLALATVLAVNPAAIVLDEPTTFLDPQGARLVFDILRELKRQGKTIIIAEQRLDLIAEHADRILALDRGRLVLDGTPLEVLTSPAMQGINLDWTRYTKVAKQACEKGLLPVELPLPASLADTAEVLAPLRRKHADSDR